MLSAQIQRNLSTHLDRQVGPHGTEDQGATAMDYMAVIAGLFRVIQQQNNIQIDFIDEDSLSAEGLAPHSALSEWRAFHAWFHSNRLNSTEYLMGD